jgi:seryl-tRNA synthetase
MLNLSFLSQNKLKSIKLLKIKNFDAKDLINELIILDEKRKKIQTNLDQTLNKINNLSKEIGNDFKNGNVNLANSKKKYNFIFERTV